MKLNFCNDFTLGAFLKDQGIVFQHSDETTFKILMDSFVPVKHKDYLENCGIKFLFTNGLSKRLLQEGIYNLADLIQKTEDDLLSIPKLGKKTIARIKDFLADKNLRLNMCFVDCTDLKYYQLLEMAKPEWFFSKKETKWLKNYFVQARTLNSLFSIKENNEKLRVTSDMSVFCGNIMRKLVRLIFTEYGFASVEKMSQDLKT